MKKIIFDLDDTLYKSPQLRAAREKALSTYLGQRVEEYRKYRKEHSTLKSLELMKIDRMRFFEIMKEVPIHLEKDNLLISLLEKLSKTYKLVVISNISLFCVKETLNQLGIVHLISEYYGDENFINSKPSEEAFSLVDKGDICVGNNYKKDLEIPKKKGAITILISESIHPKADYTIKEIYELERIIWP